MSRFVVYVGFFDVEVRVNVGRAIRYRMVNDVTISALNTMLFRIVISQMYCNARISIMDLSFFQSKILTLYDCHCPVKNKTISYKDDLKPWIDYDVKVKMKKRQNYHVLWKLGRMSRQAYCRYRNMVTSEIRNKKVLYYKTRFIELKNTMRATWKLINEVIKPGCHGKFNELKLRHGGFVVTEAQTVATLFNQYFSTIGSKVGNSIGNTSVDVRQYLLGDFVDSFFFHPVSSECVNKIIFSLKNKSCNLNEIPMLSRN